MSVKSGRLVIVAVIPIIIGLASLPVSNPSAFMRSSTDTISVCPDSTWKAEGEVFEIGICVSAGLTGVMGYNIAVTFDSSVVEIVDVDEGPLPQSASDTTFFWWYDDGVKSDYVHVNGAVLGATIDGPGELFTLTFKAKTHGVVRTTDVVIVYSVLRDGANRPIDHETRDGFVAVEPTVRVEQSTWGAIKSRYE